MKTLEEVVSLLWNRASDRLTFEELNGISQFAGDAPLMVRNLASVCGNLGALVAEDKDGAWFQDREALSQLLWSLQSQAETIHSLVRLKEEAGTKVDELLGWDVKAKIDARDRRAKQ